MKITPNEKGKKFTPSFYFPFNNDIYSLQHRQSYLWEQITFLLAIVFFVLKTIDNGQNLKKKTKTHNYMIFSEISIS